MIYFDAAATAYHRPETVRRAVYDAMGTFGSPGRGAHGAALAAARAVYTCRAQLAALFSVAEPERVCFACNATEALNTAIFGLFGPGDHVITTVCEHNSVLRPLYRLEEAGMELTVLPADAQGQVDAVRFAQALRPNTRGVVLAHASNVTGNVVNLMCIGTFCRAHGLYLVVDAAQSAGVLEIDMARMGISVLCFTGHKGLFGPQGTGGLCVAPGVDIRPLKVGGSGVHSFAPTHPADLPTGLEAGTLAAHGIAGLSAGLAFLEETGRAAVHAREDALARRFLAGVREISGVSLYGDLDAPVRTAVVSLNLRGEDAGVVADALYDQYGICVRAGAHCAPLMHRALGTQDGGAVRFSFSYFNTETEVDAGIEALRALAAP